MKGQKVAFTNLRNLQGVEAPHRAGACVDNMVHVFSFTGLESSLAVSSQCWLGIREAVRGADDARYPTEGDKEASPEER